MMRAWKETTVGRSAQILGNRNALPLGVRDWLFFPYTTTPDSVGHNYLGMKIPLSYLHTIFNPALPRTIKSFNFSRDIILLDIGSGTSEIAELAKKSNIKTVNIDLCHDGLNHARQIYRHFLGAQANATRLPFVDNTFGFIHLKDILVHIHNTVSVFKESYRVLKPGGRMLLATGRGIPGDIDYVVHNFALLKKLVESCGFSIVVEMQWTPLYEEIPSDWYNQPVGGRLIPHPRLVIEAVKPFPKILV